MGLERLAPVAGGLEGPTPPTSEPSNLAPPASEPPTLEPPSPASQIPAPLIPAPLIAAPPAPEPPAPAPPARPRYPTRQERAEQAEARASARAASIAADPAGSARQICLQLLEVGPRTGAELAAALAARGVPSEAADEVLARFTEVGIIDDALFAGMWVTSRHRGRGLAGRALAQELRRKGVQDEVAREAVDRLLPEQEAETARDLVRRRLGATRRLSTEVRVRRLVAMLARKGYGAGLAFRVVRQELEREGTDPPELSFDALQGFED